MRAPPIPAVNSSPSSGKETHTHVAYWQAPDSGSGRSDRGDQRQPRYGEGTQGPARPHAPGRDDRGAGRCGTAGEASVGRRAPQGAARADAYAGGQHGRRRDDGLQEGARDHGRRLQGRDQALRRAAVAGLLAPDRVQDTGWCLDYRAESHHGGDRRCEQGARGAAEIRSFRKPEPYKGKGVKYQGEVIRRKAGKAGGK
jgi:hypothetical protein